MTFSGITALCSVYNSFFTNHINEIIELNLKLNLRNYVILGLNPTCSDCGYVCMYVCMYVFFLINYQKST